MMKCNGWPVGVCSWSLQSDPPGVAAAMRQLKIDHVNLALKPAFREQGEEYLAAVGRQDWTITATTIGFFQEDYTSLARIRATGGIVPDEHWPENRRMVERAAEITAAMGVGHLTMHAGFLESGDAEEQKKVRDRLGWLADAAARLGIGLLLETGQETAECLRALLEELDHPALGVNFDPANMILYGKGDPLAAARLLGRWIKHIHVKDAVAAERPGEWGREVPWGDGQVGGETFLESLKEIGFAGALAIEREAGRDRLGDIGRAAERLAGWQAP
ncbi:MAG: sugar phosphate isomerase/epimerase [Pirellulaceae bacterium]|nr:sugar phosphate isomerase/epimerase [Thermoguttaceae bacterium]NLY99510.1 sugar phosphate isomerase/epimerase [Pirellulaceae bacterium]